MSRKIWRGTVSAVVLATTLAGPAQAAGFRGWPEGNGVLAQAWQWVSGWLGSPGETAPGKRGAGVDPNGGTVTTDTSPTTFPLPDNDRGAGVDPNG